MATQYQYDTGIRDSLYLKFILTEYTVTGKTVYLLHNQNGFKDVSGKYWVHVILAEMHANRE